MSKADEPDPDEPLTERLRKAAAARDERQRMWNDREYPQSAYDAVALLAARVPPPKGFAEGWRSHIESVLRDSVKGNDARDVKAIAAEAEPTLQATAKSLRNIGVARSAGSTTSRGRCA